MAFFVVEICHDVIAKMSGDSRQKRLFNPCVMSWESVLLNVEIKSCLYNVHVGGTVDRSYGN